MRELVHEALAGARDMVGEVVNDLRKENRLTDDEVLIRYEQQHRGNPWAMISFAQQSGARDPVGQAVRYEAEMEKMVQRRMGGQ